MSELLHRKTRGSFRARRSYGREIVEISFGDGGTAPTITLEDGQKGIGVCLGCPDTPCMKKDPSEHNMPTVFENFPGDPSSDVCPTQALSWNDSAGTIDVSSECIGCGLCVVRCPYGALYLEGGEKLAILREIKAGRTVDTKEASESKTHASPRRIGRLGKATAPALQKLESSLGALSDTRAMLLVRNLLHEAGIQCRVRRKGDTNVRIDAVTAFDDGKVGVVEVELSGAALESPRAILEDIAVLHSRFAMPLSAIVPVSIVLSLPNARSEYYRVIHDIYEVLQLRVRTLTLGSIFLVVWGFGRIESLEGDTFATDEDGCDLTASVARTLGVSVSALGEPYRGALRTAK